MTGASGAYTTTYAYNAIGNITSFEGQVYTYTTKPHAVDAVGSNSYGYDANGNMISRSVDGTNYTLVYDAENRLVEVSGGASASFVYDGDGNRVKATFGTTTTVYIGDYYEQTGSTVKKYYYATGQRVAMRENGTLYWLLTDHLRSTAVTADSSSTQVAEIRYKAWGEARYTSGTTPTTFRFTGQREESTIGLYDYGARWYDPLLGRFVQADPIVPEPGNPQALNRYAYTLNNPLRYVDPTGHQPEWWDRLVRRARRFVDRAHNWWFTHNPCNWMVYGCVVSPQLPQPPAPQSPSQEFLIGPEEAERLREIAWITDRAERMAQLSTVFRYRPGAVEPGSYEWYQDYDQAERARIFAETYGIELGDIDIVYDPDLRVGTEGLYIPAGKKFMGRKFARDTIVIGPGAFFSQEELGVTLFHELLEREREAGRLTHDEIYELQELWREWYRSLTEGW